MRLITSSEKKVLNQSAIFFVKILVQKRCIMLYRAVQSGNFQRGRFISLAFCELEAIEEKKVRFKTCQPLKLFFSKETFNSYCVTVTIYLMGGT